MKNVLIFAAGMVLLPLVLSAVSLIIPRTCFLSLTLIPIVMMVICTFSFFQHNYCGESMHVFSIIASWKQDSFLPLLSSWRVE